MTELELQQRIKDEAFISSTAWVMIILVGVVLYWALVGGVAAQLVAEFQSSFLADPPGGMPNDMMTELRRGRQQSLLILGILIVGCILLMMTAIAVLKRRNWGRVLMTISILVLVAIDMFIVFYVGSKAMRKLNELVFRMPAGDEGFHNTFETAARLQFFSYGLFSILICWLMVRAVIKLNRPRIRALFS